MSIYQGNNRKYYARNPAITGSPLIGWPAWSANYGLNFIATGVNWSVTGAYVLSNQSNTGVTVTRTGIEASLGTLTATYNNGTSSVSMPFSSGYFHLSFYLTLPSYPISPNHTARVEINSFLGIIPGTYSDDYRFELHLDRWGGIWELWDYHDDIPDYFEFSMPSFPYFNSIGVKVTAIHSATGRSCSEIGSIDVGRGGGHNGVVYPNPVDDILYIDLSQIAQAQARNNATFDVRLYDGQGNLLRQTYSNGGLVQFGVTNLSDGLYYIHVYDGVNHMPQIYQVIVEH